MQITQVFASKTEKTVRCADCGKPYRTSSEDAPCPYCGNDNETKDKKPKKAAQRRRKK